MKKDNTIALVMILALLLPGCSELNRAPKIDDGIITSASVSVRSSVAELALEVAKVKRGDEVEVLERRHDGWVRVRTASGVEGWVKAHSVTRKALVQEANALARRLKDLPMQAVGQLSGPTTLRASPGRASDANAILTLPARTLVQVLDRQRTPRGQNRVLAKQYQPRSRRSHRRSSATNAAAGQRYDDWYQVRLPESFLVRAGWVYAPLVDLHIPPRLVQLQENYSIVGWFEVGQVNDAEIGPAHHYLTLCRRRFGPITGTDFDRLQLFWWNPNQHQYRRSARPVSGILPVLPQKRNGAWVFQVKAYDRRTGRLETRRYLVDVRNPLHPRFARLRK